MTEKRTVLFLCTGNSARSQMAEALVNQHLGGAWSAKSAGTHPAPSIHPLAVEVLMESGIDISSQEPKSIRQLQNDQFDLAITLCDDAARSCPLWLGSGQIVHMPFPDPASAIGGRDERLKVFRQVRHTIEARVLNHLRDADNNWQGDP